MGSLATLVDLARNAISANQTALDVTGNNVANQNVAGYTRQTVLFTSDVVTIGGQSVGYGVDTGSNGISQRDRVLEQRVQQQTQTESASSARETALKQLQAIFGLSSTPTAALSTTLGTAIDSFFNSFGSLAAAPADAATRQAVLSAAGTLVSAFQSATNQVTAVNSGLTQTAGTIVGKVNGLTAQIAALNKQISTLSPHTDAGLLEDQRQSLVASLSDLVGLNQVTTEDNGLTLSTTDGTVLVSGVKSFALAAGSAGGQATITGAGSSVDISAKLSGGELGGLLSAQQNEGSSLKGSLDQLAFAVANAVNTQNEAGLDGNGVAGAALFSVTATATGAAHSLALATSDPEAIAAAGTGEGSGGNTNANALAGLTDAPLVAGETAAGSLVSVLTALGTAVSSATGDATVQAAALTQLTTQRDALSGVSLDEEAASLTQYQRSYQAAAKVFSIADSLFQAALNLGEQTTV